MHTLPLHVPASLATEIVGITFAGSLQPGEPQNLDRYAGFLLVSVHGSGDDRWFATEAVYNLPTSYMYAVADCQRARRADPTGPYRRVVPVYVDGTYA